MWIEQSELGCLFEIKNFTEVDIEVEIKFVTPGFVSKHVIRTSSTSWKRGIQEWPTENEMRATPCSRRVLFDV